MPIRDISSLALIFIIFLNLATGSAAQSSGGKSDIIEGIVINGITHEPIARALVASGDNQYATLTNSEGRFEFSVPKDTTGPDTSGHDRPRLGVSSGGPQWLTARKPGYLDSQYSGVNVAIGSGKDLVMMLVPEALIVGTVSLPTSEAPDSITLDLYRKQVNDGRAHWSLAASAQSKSDGQFRFAELGAGTYKLLTQELLDRDPLSFDLLGQLFGYPPVYYQNATDFASASEIQLPAGETLQVNLVLAKQPYYQVKIPVTGSAENYLNVSVLPQGHRGPGFSLGYNNEDQSVEGMLPNGTYTVEVSSYGRTGGAGSQKLTVKGGAVEGPNIPVIPNRAIPIAVKEEFTSGKSQNGTAQWNINGRLVTIRSPRRYLNLYLEPAEDFMAGQRASLGPPTGNEADDIILEGVQPGEYWVRVNSSLGYVASVRSGNLDFLHQPLAVVNGGAVSSIEITMRDDAAEVSGTVEGIRRGEDKTAGEIGQDATLRTSRRGQLRASIYCIPLPDNNGQFAQGYANENGSFVLQGLAPGAYRVLAFDREQPELEYTNPQAMQAYDAQGPVVHLTSNQKEKVQLHLISTKGE